MEEIWKDIKGYEGLYQVSNLGRIRSLGNGCSNNSKERILKLEKDKCGYLRVQLCKDGIIKKYLIHRLVANAFLPNPLNLPQVNHKDEDKTNNRVENIEWCDSRYNINYGTRNERISKPVLQYTLSGVFVREWSSTKECGRNGFNACCISRCCRCLPKYHTHKGYIWKYKEVV